MICKLCGKDTIEKKQIKDGYICPECYRVLPRSFRDNAKKITIKQLSSAKKIIKPKYSKPWAICESVKICNTSIQIDNWEIELKNIKSIKLNFHPKNSGSKDGYVYGVVTLLIETTEPKIQIEEPFISTEIRYYISGKDISYSYPTNIQQMFTNIQQVIDEGTFEMLKFKPNKEEYHKHQQANRNGGKRMTEFERAKTLYEVEIPFTVEEINKKKKELMKKYHPDLGGDTEKAIEINAAYDLLVKFAD